MYSQSLILCVFGLITAVTSLEDATAYINHLFTYPLKLTEGSKVIQSGSDTLPSWLHYDHSSHSLKGVPSKSDKGTIILEVRENGESDMFAVSVLPNPSSVVAQPVASLEQVFCKPHESITIVNVMLDADLDKLDATLKSRIVENLAKHLTMKPNHVVLKRSTPDLYDSSALIQRVGDSLGDAQSVLSWIAGCGAVKPEQLEQLEQLESSAKDGSLKDALKFGITSWQVSSKTLKPKGRRLKRQILTATPTPGMSTEVTQITKATTDGVQPTTTPKESTVTTTTETPSTKLPLTTPPLPPPSLTTLHISTTTTQEQTTPVLIVTEEPTVETTQPPSVPPPITTPPPSTNEKPFIISDRREMVINVTEGQLNSYGFDMINNMFSDPEGEKLTYELRFKNNLRDVNSVPTWIKFTSGDIPEIKALPTSEQMGQNVFDLVAIDPERQESESILVSINVQRADMNIIKQWYKIEIDSTSIRSYWNFLFDFISKIQIDNLIGKVQYKGKVQSGGTVIVTVGDTSTQTCSGTTRDALRMLENYQLKNTEVTIIAVRVKVVPPCKDGPPVLNEALWNDFKTNLKPVLGVLFVARLPNRLFRDENMDEDYDLKSLDVELKIDGLTTTDKSWINYDKSSQSLKGLVWDADEAETGQYSLIAIDSGKNIPAQVDFEIKVDQLSRVMSHAFAVTLDMDYDKFMASRTEKIQLYEKLMKAFPPNSQVVINKFRRGSVIVELSLEEPLASTGTYGPEPADCPDKVKTYTKSVYDEQNQVKPGFVEALTPYTVTQVDFNPEGKCKDELSPITAEVSHRDETKTPDNTTMIIVIVVVVLVVIILGVIIVVVCLARRKKKARHNISKNNGQYIERGVPTVFDEEMKDQKDPAENQPLMSDNKPKPPAYPNGKSDNDRGDYQPPTPPISEPEEALA